VSQDTVSGVRTLSDRQKEVLRLMARHHKAKEIAKILEIRETTVRTHIEEARRRLGGVSSGDAVRALLEHEAVASANGSAETHTAPLLKNSGPQFFPIPELGSGLPSSGHETDPASQRHRPDHQHDRTGEGSESSVQSGQAPPRSGHSLRPEGGEHDGRVGERDPDTGRLDSLVDGHWNVFVGRGQPLKFWQVAAVTFIVIVLLSMGLTVIFQAQTVFIRAVQTFKHQSG
jgi:DNA-binding CsgD family transcriptional regulator